MEIISFTHLLATKTSFPANSAATAKSPQVMRFPQFTNKNNYKIESYMHIGQHSECDPLIVHDTKLATENEYEPLLKEIESIYDDYEIKIMKKLNIKWQ